LTITALYKSTYYLTYLLISTQNTLHNLRIITVMSDYKIALNVIIL